MGDEDVYYREFTDEEEHNFENFINSRSLMQYMCNYQDLIVGNYYVMKFKDNQYLIFCQIYINDKRLTSRSIMLLSVSLLQTGIKLSVYHLDLKSDEHDQMNILFVER